MSADRDEPSAAESRLWLGVLGIVLIAAGVYVVRQLGELVEHSERDTSFEQSGLSEKLGAVSHTVTYGVVAPSEVVALLDDDDARVRASMLAALEELDDVDAYVPRVREALLDDPSRNVRAQAALTLVRIDPDHEAVARELIDLMTSAAAESVPWLADAMIELKPESLDALVPLARSPNPIVREHVLRVAQKRPVGDPDTPTLARCVIASEPDNAIAYELLLRESALSVQETVDALSSNRLQSQVIALQAIGSGQCEDARVVPDLAEIVADRKPSDEQRFGLALTALMRLGPLARNAVPTVLATAEGPVTETCFDRLLVAWLIGASTDELAPLIDRLIEADGEFFRNAGNLGRVVRGCGDDTVARVLPRLIERLRSGSREQILTTLEILKGLDDAARPALSAIRRLLQEADAQFRWGAVEVLANLNDKDVIPFLGKYLNTATGWEYATRLGQFGPDARALFDEIESRVAPVGDESHNSTPQPGTFRADLVIVPLARIAADDPVAAQRVEALLQSHSERILSRRKLLAAIEVRRLLSPDEVADLIEQTLTSDGADEKSQHRARKLAAGFLDWIPDRRRRVELTARCLSDRSTAVAGMAAVTLARSPLEDHLLRELLNKAVTRPGCHNLISLTWRTVNGAVPWWRLPDELQRQQDRFGLPHFNLRDAARVALKAMDDPDSATE